MEVSRKCFGSYLCKQVAFWKEVSQHCFVSHMCNLHFSWQAQHFVNLKVQISWQAQHFVNLHAQMSWQAQHFVNLDAALHASATCIFEGSLVRNAFLKDSGHEMPCLCVRNASPNLDREAPTTVAGRSRAMAGSWSDRFRSGTVVSGVRGVCQVLQISWQAQRFVNLNVQISWQAQHFVNLNVHISWQAQRFVNFMRRFRGRRSTL